MDEGGGGETGIEILLVEDNPGDVRLFEETLHETNSTLHITNDGKQALDFLHRRNEFTGAPCPDIVLLDLNLPKVDGVQVFDEIRSSSELEDLRVIIISSAQEEYTNLEQDILDKNDFLTKPADPEEFMALVRSSIFD
ncbi:response regulator [Natrinema versiforme]|uniref:Response regulator receiver protein n=1 Tax=Natrinema versiforme JCM 10478 TaxID=1227496 RepID=L9Y089_9EURY|nr:response regulator [Natrinema versiforme]ELY66288.1 response regulator receiver protein [Natrinema versiforme JCM 10478]